MLGKCNASLVSIYSIEFNFRVQQRSIQGVVKQS